MSTTVESSSRRPAQRRWLANSLAVAVLAIALVVPSLARADDSAPADDGFGVTPVGSLFTRYELRRNYGPGPDAASDFVRYRTRFGLRTDPFAVSDGVDVTVRFVPQATGFWHIGGSSLAEPGISLHEGATVIETECARLEFGRFEMVYGDHLVIGNVGWHPTGRTFDGGRARFSLGDAGSWIDVFATATEEGLVSGGGVGPRIGAGDMYFTGVYGAFGPSIADDLALDAYALARIAPQRDIMGPDPTNPAGASVATHVDGATELTFGARTRGNAGAVDWRLEAGVQAGSRAGDPDASVFGEQFEGEVGASFIGDNRLRLALGGFFASGDDPVTADKDEGWNQLFPTAHKFLGLMDVVGGRTNVFGAMLRVRAKLTDQLTATLDAHEFHRPQDTAIEAGRLGLEAGRLGLEVDAGLAYRIGQGLTVRGLYGLFLTAEDFSDEDFHFAEFELKFVLP